MATQVQVAAHLDITRQWLITLIKKGILPGGKGRGGADIDDCRVQYIRYLRSVGSKQTIKVSERVDEDDVNLELERAKNLRVDTAIKERKRDAIDRTVAPVHLLEWVLSGVGSQISALLGTIPQKIKRRVPRLSATEIGLIEKEIIKCQNIAANVTVDLDAYESAN